MAKQVEIELGLLIFGKKKELIDFEFAKSIKFLTEA